MDTPGIDREKQFLTGVAREKHGTFAEWSRQYLEGLNRRYWSFDSYPPRPMLESERRAIREHVQKLKAGPC